MDNFVNKTIAAISTALMPAGISVIRISGDNSKVIADKIFVSYNKKNIADIPGYSCVYGFIKDKDDNKIDDVIVTVFSNPHSYTGEDVIEISCHGGIFISKNILNLVLSNGAEPALPGEFTKRAFLNGKMDLTKAESVVDIINASSNKAAKLAENAHSGSLFKKIKNITNAMSEKCAHLEAWADYPDEEIEQINSQELLSDLNSYRTQLKKLLDNYDNGKIIRDGVNTAIIGKANVGKSTFMNLLSGFQRSIVTDIPGTTRDTVEERVVISDMVLNLCDTAGIRDTENIVEKIGVERALDKISTSDLILAVFDYSDELSEKDLDIIKNIKNIPVIAIINKTDLEKKLDCDYIENNMKNVVYISASNEDGIESFKNVLKNVFDLSFAEGSNAVMINERQRHSVMTAYENINNAVETLENSLTFDAVTVCIEEAMQALLELTGEKVSDVVVDKIFSRFCVGK